MAEELSLLFSPPQIERRVRRLARQISRDYRGKVPLLVCVLKGAFVFLADLIREMTIPVEVEFVRASSYGSAMSSSGTVRLEGEVDVEGRDVLLVEDIIDTGLSVKVLADYILSRSPASFKVCALVDKKERREVEVKVDYVGFEIERGFIVGYGIDYDERYRHLPGIYVVEKRP